MSQAVKFSTSDTFEFTNWTYAPDVATLFLNYRLGQYKFTERFIFSNTALEIPLARADQFAKACNLLHIIAGISYFKCSVPENIICSNQTLSHKQAQFFNKLYKNGLAEFAYNNKLDLTNISFPVSTESSTAAQPLVYGRSAKILVPIGGGKDSLVTVELLKKAGISFTPFVLGEFDRINQVLEVINLPALKVQRILDPQLFELNKLGAFNGHVPISAIIAASLVVTGVLHDFDTAILSNERSADIANFHNSQGAVNHQYSKSFEFEQDFQDYLDSFVGSKFRYFSLLRPLSELAVASHFLKNTIYDQVFSSCNKNFVQAGKATKRWCLNCPKCYSTFICLATFLSPKRMNRIFGQNLLNNPSGIELVSELIGIKGHKPFECVIDTAEALAAFTKLATDSNWSEAYLVQWYNNLNIKSEYSVADFIHPQGKHNIPEEFIALIYEN